MRVFLLVGLLLTSCGQSFDSSPSSTSTGKNFKAVVMAGDDSIKVFDNMRATIVADLKAHSVTQVAELSANPKLATGDVLRTSLSNLNKSFESLELQPEDSCLLYMTSHGTPQGYYIRGSATITPAQLNATLTKHCGSRPTVVIVSACYSGVFLEQGMSQPNRVILTAARKDRTSFGCGSEFQYTYYDACVLDNFNSSTSWESLYKNVSSCVTKKEGSSFKPSLPQGFFGSLIDFLASTMQL